MESEMNLSELDSVKRRENHSVDLNEALLLSLDDSFGNLEETEDNLQDGNYCSFRTHLSDSTSYLLLPDPLKVSQETRSSVEKNVEQQPESVERPTSGAGEEFRITGRPSDLVGIDDQFMDAVDLVNSRNLRGLLRLLNRTNPDTSQSVHDLSSMQNFPYLRRLQKLRCLFYLAKLLESTYTECVQNLHTQKDFEEFRTPVMQDKKNTRYAESHCCFGTIEKSSERLEEAENLKKYQFREITTIDENELDTSNNESLRGFEKTEGSESSNVSKLDIQKSFEHFNSPANIRDFDNSDYELSFNLTEPNFYFTDMTNFDKENFEMMYDENFESNFSYEKNFPCSEICKDDLRPTLDSHKQSSDININDGTSCDLDRSCNLKEVPLNILLRRMMDEIIEKHSSKPSVPEIPEVPKIRTVFVNDSVRKSGHTYETVSPLRMQNSTYKPDSWRRLTTVLEESEESRLSNCMRNVSDWSADSRKFKMTDEFQDVCKLYGDWLVNVPLDYCDNSKTPL